MPIRLTRARPEHGRLDEHKAAIIKGMLARGDKQSDIAAFFRVNGGRIAEINCGHRFANVRVALPDELPAPRDRTPTRFVPTQLIFLPAVQAVSLDCLYA